MNQTTARSLIVTDVVRRTFLSVRQNLFVFIGFAAPSFAIIQLIHGFALGNSPLETSLSLGTKLLRLPIQLRLLNDFLSTSVSVISGAAITASSCMSMLGEKVSLRDGIFAVWRSSRALLYFILIETALSSSNLILSLLGKLHPSSLALAMTLLLSFALAIAFLIVFLIWSMAVPVMVFEQANVLAALKRSATLTHHQRSAIFGVGLIFVAIFFALSLPLWGLTGIGIPPRAPLYITTPVGFASALMSIALQIFFAASAGVIYVKLREFEDSKTIESGLSQA